MIDTVRCEVLNASYEPLSITSGRKALLLYLKGKAEILQEHASYTLRSDNDIHPVPTQIRLKTMVKGRPTTRTPAPLTQRNLFVRDRYTCVYCGRHRLELQENNEFLTRDHIFPQGKGGRDEWTNVATACNRCNNKKADCTLSELKTMGIPIRYAKEGWEPYKPTVFEIWSKSFSKRIMNI